MPILEYRWCGSTVQPFGCTALAFSENLSKFPGALSDRGLANRVLRVTGGKTSKRQKAKQKTKKDWKQEQKTIKHKKDSGFDFQIGWIKFLY